MRIFLLIKNSVPERFSSSSCTAKSGVVTTQVAKTILFCTMRPVNKKFAKFVLEISSLASEVVIHNQKRVNNNNNSNNSSNNNNNNNNLYTGSSLHKESFSEALLFSQLYSIDK